MPGVNTHSAAWLGVSIDPIKIVAWDFKFQVGNGTVEPGLRLGEHVELVLRDGMFDKLKVLAILKRANIQMSNFKMISTLAVLPLKNCSPRVGVNIPANLEASKLES